MANTYHQIYLQSIFAVKHRNATIDKAWRPELFGVIGNLINEANARTLIVNGTADHVHCLFGLRPVVSISELMKSVKARSSKYINDHSLTVSRFEWQEGYGAFSYGKSDIEAVYRYIADQDIHHQLQTFRQEYLALLEEFGVTYDPQYIFQDLT